VRFGIILTNQHPPGAPIVERFADAIEQVRLARDLGFDPSFPTSASRSSKARRTRA
jgi:hypothetical protein